MTAQTYTRLNAELNLYSAEGKLQLDKDRAAARAYFLEFVNPNTWFFHDLEEKIGYLIENDYWDGEVFKQYKPDFIKKAFKSAYDKKFRFPAFMGAYKFYTSYALKSNDGTRILERYEDRVTMCALYLAQGDEKFALSLIEEIIEGRFQPATPTFQNAGKARRGELVSCFLLNVSDSLDSIKDTWNYCAQLSKAGGGVAINLTNLRERGAPLKGKEGLAKGIVPWMKIYEDIFSTVDQLGTRQGAGAVYLSVHHPDIINFLDCKRENADEKIRIKTLSTGVVIPDITFELARNNHDMYLFSPYDVQRVYGEEFSNINITEKYHEMVDNPKIRKTKTNARRLLQTIAEIQGESGYPYIVFSDTANKANPIDGVINMSNLCVTADTMILTDQGYRKVKDLHSTQEDFDVIVDTRARDMDASKIGMSQEKSTKMFQTAQAADIYKVSTHEGFSLRATAWHKMYVMRDSEVQKIELHELEPGDKILVQSAEGAWGTIHEPDLAYVAGAIAADGSIVDGVTTAGNNTSTARITLYGDKDEFADALTTAVHNVLEGREDLTNRQSTITPEFVVQNYDRITLHSAPLATLLREKGMGKLEKVRVPKFVLHGDKETQQAYLNGVIQLDGSVTGSVKAGTAGIELGSVDKKFLQDIQMILLNFNVYSRIYESRAAQRGMLPDGKGGQAEYNQQTMYSLRVTARRDREILFPLITWKQAHKARWEKLNKTQGTKKPYESHRFLATVSEVVFDAVEDVYDVTVDNGHSVIFNGIATGNCSEILQVNTPSTYDPETGELTEVGQDISCNLGSMNVYEAMQSPDFAKTVETSMRALTAVSDLTSIHRVPTVKLANERMHSVGLGQMALATYFGTHKMHYGDETSLDFTNMYFMAVNYYSLLASHKIAVERKDTFYGFEKSKYADGTYFDMYTAGEELSPKTKRVAQLFEDAGIHLPTQADWEKLKKKVMKDGIWHSYRLAVPPTGSISYINNASASIHPITALIEIRKEGSIGRVYYPTPHLSDDNMEYFKDAYAVGPEKLIDVYAEATKHTDQGLSCTLFYYENATTRDFNKSQIYAWRKGLETLYYIRLRAVQLEGTESDECVSCAL